MPGRACPFAWAFLWRVSTPRRARWLARLPHGSRHARCNLRRLVARFHGRHGAAGRPCRLARPLGWPVLCLRLDAAASSSSLARSAAACQHVFGRQSPILGPLDRPPASRPGTEAWRAAAGSVRARARIRIGMPPRPRSNMDSSTRSVRRSRLPACLIGRCRRVLLPFLSH